MREKWRSGLERARKCERTGEKTGEKKSWNKEKVVRDRRKRKRGRGLAVTWSTFREYISYLIMFVFLPPKILYNIQLKKSYEMFVHSINYTF